ncbi:hypothetical protein [Ulvibacterium sp.]|uniref:hypothetical protein n=1 Tax=Ulvibacterium sp. TaxID=2665914 RepID=UPI003BAA135E
MIYGKRELQRLIDQIYTSLRPKTLELFKLSKNQGLTHQEIASLKNISAKTVLRPNHSGGNKFPALV